MEILGMETTFQKTFSDSEFIEIIPFPNQMVLLPIFFFDAGRKYNGNISD